MGVGKDHEKGDQRDKYLIVSVGQIIDELHHVLKASVFVVFSGLRLQILNPVKRPAQIAPFLALHALKLMQRRGRRVVSNAIRVSQTEHTEQKYGGDQYEFVVSVSPAMREQSSKQHQHHEPMIDAQSDSPTINYFSDFCLFNRFLNLRGIFFKIVTKFVRFFLRISSKEETSKIPKRP